MNSERGMNKMASKCTGGTDKEEALLGDELMASIVASLERNNL